MATGFGAAKPAVTFGAAAKPAVSFGATKPAAATGGGFGFGATKPAGTTTGFAGFGAGAKTGTTTTGFGVGAAKGFGAAAQPTAQQLLEQQAEEEAKKQDPVDVAIRKNVAVVHDKWPAASVDDGSTAELIGMMLNYVKEETDSYGFRKIVYNRWEPGSTKGKYLTPKEWERERTENRFDYACDPKVELMPVALVGFGELGARIKQQKEATVTNSRLVSVLLQTVQRVRLECEAARARVDRVYAKQAQLLDMLLRVARKADLLVLRQKDVNDGEFRLYEIIARLRDYLITDAHLKERLDQLVLMHRMREDAAAAGLSVSGYGILPSGSADAAEEAGVGGEGATGFSDGLVPWSSTDIESIATRLAVHGEGIAQAMDILEEDVMTLKVVREQVARMAEARQSKEMPAGYRV